MMPERQAPSLPLKGWCPGNHQALITFLQRHTPHVSEHITQHVKSAAFDWDNTCVFGDVGDAALYQQLSQGPLNLPQQQFRVIVRRALEALSGDLFGRLCHDVTVAYSIAGAPQAGKISALQRASARQDLTCKLLLFYQLGCREAPGAMYLFAATLFAALAQDDIDQQAQEIVARQTGSSPSPITLHSATAGSAGPGRVTLDQALMPFEEMRSLMHALRGANIEPYIISASHQTLVRAAALAYAFPVASSHIFGVRPHAPAPYPLTCGPGKSSIIAQHLPAPPILVAGDAKTDLNMMLDFAATEVRLLLHRPQQQQVLATLEGAQRGHRGVTLVQGHSPTTGRFNGRRLSGLRAARYGPNAFL